MKEADDSFGVKHLPTLVLQLLSNWRLQFYSDYSQKH